MKSIGSVHPVHKYLQIIYSLIFDLILIAEVKESGPNRPQLFTTTQPVEEWN